MAVGLAVGLDVAVGLGTIGLAVAVGLAVGLGVAVGLGTIGLAVAVGLAVGELVGDGEPMVGSTGWVVDVATSGGASCGSFGWRLGVGEGGAEVGVLSTSTGEASSSGVDVIRPAEDVLTCWLVVDQR